MMRARSIRELRAEGFTRREGVSGIVGIDHFELLLGVLVYLKEMGIQGVPMDVLHELFYQAEEAGHPIVNFQFTTECGKPYSDQLAKAVDLLYNLERVYRGRKLRARASARHTFLKESKIRRFSSESMKQIRDVAEFIAASKKV